MKKRLLSILLTCVMVIALVCGCAKKTSNNNPSSGTTANPEDPTKETPTEAPAMDYEIVIGTTSQIEKAVYGEYAFDMLASGVSELPMVYQDTEGAFHPLMVTYESTDATTWTYTVVEGMTWSDGEKVTAEDILFTLQYEDANGSANLIDQGDGAKYTAYELSDDKMSISLTLSKANVRELTNMTSFRVVPKHILEGNDNPSEADLRVTAGPFVFDEFNANAGTISFKVNEHYPKKPNVAHITYQLFDNEDTMYIALQKGDIDMVWAYSMGVAATYQDVLAADDGIKLVNIPALNAPSVLAFNNAKGPFADINLRKAVMYALDYEKFKEYIGSKYAEIPNMGFVPTSTVGYKATDKLSTNLEKAAEYMQTAGYTKNADGMYANANGDVCEFTLTIRADKAAHVSAGEIIKTSLESFGIKVNLENIDSDSYNAKTSNKFSEKNITMEAAIFGYTAAGMGMMNGLATIYVDGSHAVQGGCQVYDDKFVAIRDEMAAAGSIEEYVKAAGKMQEFYAEATPLVGLYWDNMMYAHRAQWNNVTIDAVFGINNVNNWFTITK